MRAEVPEPGPHLEASGWDYLNKYFSEILLSMGVLLLAAGTIDVPRAWLFLLINLGFSIVSSVIVAILNPEVLNQRNNAFRHNTKKWDVYLLSAYIFLDSIVMSVMAGLDTGRFSWSSMPDSLFLVGLAAYAASSALTVLAMVYNRYYEISARIQYDRSQRVVEDGPYGWIRHPGYSAIILGSLSVPLLLGSLYSFVCALAIVGIMIERTRREDELLRDELAGYAEYAARVRYRLLPFVW